MLGDLGLKLLLQMSTTTRALTEFVNGASNLISGQNYVVIHSIIILSATLLHNTLLRIARHATIYIYVLHAYYQQFHAIDAIWAILVISLVILIATSRRKKRYRVTQLINTYRIVCLLFISYLLNNKGL